MEYGNYHEKPILNATSSTSKLITCSKIPLHNFFFKLKRTFTSPASLYNFLELIQKRNSKTSTKLSSTNSKPPKILNKCQS